MREDGSDVGSWRRVHKRREEKKLVECWSLWTMMKTTEMRMEIFHNTFPIEIIKLSRERLILHSCWRCFNTSHNISLSLLFPWISIRVNLSSFGHVRLCVCGEEFFNFSNHRKTTTMTPHKLLEGAEKKQSDDVVGEVWWARKKLLGLERAWEH